jgi:hypothetical protein
MLVWSYLYSRLNENNTATIYIYEIMSKYKMPKSTMKRIVDYGVQFIGFKVDYKWIYNSLIISINDGVSEPKTTSKRTYSEPKKVLVGVVKSSNIQYPNMIEVYDKFCQDKTGVGCKIDGAQGKAMKRIIKFLESQCKKKDNLLENEKLDEMVLLAWNYILTNWNKLDDFNRGRIKLTEIDSNMLNILSKLKEKPINQKQKQRNEQINKAITGANSTDYSRLGP